MKHKTVLEKTNKGKLIKIVSDFNIDEFDEFLKQENPFQCEGGTRPERINKNTLKYRKEQAKLKKKNGKFF